MAAGGCAGLAAAGFVEAVGEGAAVDSCLEHPVTTRMVRSAATRRLEESGVLIVA